MTTHAFQPATFDTHNINDTANYEACFIDDQHGLPRVNVVSVGRNGRWPVIAGITRPGRTLALRITLRGSNKRTLRRQLSQWFDPEDEEAKVFTATYDGTSYYVRAICEELREESDSIGQVFIARLVIDGDVRWRKVTTSTDTWNISSDTDTNTIANNGEDDAYPIFTLTPTDAKAGYNEFRRWVPVVWHAGGATKYPLDIVDNALDTAALVTATKMQADGDDIRVLVDGQMVEYWLDDINTNNTSIWCNLDFEAAPTTTALLEAALGSGDTITSLDSSTDISGYPSSGILLINSEAFVYTGKSDSLRRFTGVTRAAKGTTAANHSAADEMYWVQHDIYVTYGDATADAYPVDDDNKPAFDLATSTNGSWNYDDFGADAGKRAGGWQFTGGQNTTKYTANQNTDADPWSEMGIRAASPPDGPYNGYWTITNPCGITQANFANGEKWSSTGVNWGAQVIRLGGASRSWSVASDIAGPSTANTWQSWSASPSFAAGTTIGVGFRLQNALGVFYAGEARLEVADVTLTLSGDTPDITIGAEASNYPLDAIIRNNTTGDEIHVTLTMDEDEDLEIDTDAKTVTYLLDNSNQFGALTVVGSARLPWLRLVPGNNELYFEDTGTAGLTLVTDFEERFYG